jgi:3-deoxy-D-manno-octulosonate 8-phosphate phosphatase (KDO 8-P phosphatase)
MSYRKLTKIKKSLIRWDKIKLLVFDCDGVLTDGRIIYDSGGVESKNFHAQDGMGFMLLRQTEVQVAVITGRRSELLQRRCEDLKINHLFQGEANKLQCLTEFLQQLGFDFSNVLYMGDDWNDLLVMNNSAFSVCPADAPEKIRGLVDHVTTKAGGRGAVRECIDFVLAKKGLYEQAVQAYLDKIG